MKNIINIFCKPRKAIADIITEEPVFSGLAVFLIAVLIGNFSRVAGFAINIPAGIFYFIIVVMLWFAGIVVADIIITLVLKLINPLSSSLLDVERFRKLIVVQLFISQVLIIRPVLTLFLSNRLAWILISMWAAVLILITVVKLWNVTEIKAVVAAAASVIVLYIIVNVLLVFPSDFDSTEFLKLKAAAESSLPSPRVSLLGLRKVDGDRQSAEGLRQAAESYLSSNNRNSAYGYALALKAHALMQVGRRREAEMIYRQILSLSGSIDPLCNSVQLTLYNYLSPESFVRLETSRSFYRWEPVFSFLKVPAIFSGYRPRVRDAGLVKEIINNASENELADYASKIIKNWEGSVFEDDIIFWIAEKFSETGNTSAAASYWRESASAVKRYDEERLKAESVLYFIERLSGQENIFKEKNRAPQSLFLLARLYKNTGAAKRAKSIYREVLDNYPVSIFAADSLFELAQIAEEDGDFEEAIKLYSSLLNSCEVSNLRDQARHKRDIISKNLQNKELLAAYSRGWTKWQQGDNAEAIEIYKELIDNYRKSEIAYELQYNLGTYYRDTKDYMKALYEFRTGYNDFSGTPRGFDFARQVGNVLGEDLRYWRRSVNWYKKVLQEYEPGYSSGFSKVGVIDLAWKAADICRQRLRDYSEAKNIYSDIINRYSDKDTAARAMYETAYIDEVIYGRYSNAVSQYRKIITGYPGTEWKEKASTRMEDIYRRGTELLERYR
ncbi:MAG: tetratricopeptide repeat protein [Elusimicrobiota bacterium]|nr:tetratricopeptide repeat protein [Elusimicrobiota bacterium]